MSCVLRIFSVVRKFRKTSTPVRKQLAIATALCFTPLGVCANAQAISSQQSKAIVVGAHRPASVPEGYAITPNGYFHPSCLKELAEGDTILRDEGNIRHADGTFDTIPACKYPHYTRTGKLVGSGSSALADL